jgi:hypothetical protein
MFDLPTSMLTQQAASRPRSGEELETLGKYAASLYGREGKTLSEAVVAAVKTAGLSPEQVKRVVEFANHTAYSAEFQKESAAHRMVNFRGGPADPSAVLQDLNDGGGGTVFDTGLGDYKFPPSELVKAAERNAARLGIEDAKLAAAFGLTEEVVLPPADPLRPALDAKDKLAGLHAAAQSELSGEESYFLDICDALTFEVKQASLRGVPLSHMVAAWGTVNPEPVLIKAAFNILADRLVDQGVFPSRSAMIGSLSEKVASAPVNPKHPLVLVYNDFCGSLRKMASLRQLGEECAEGVDKLQAFLKDTVKAASLAQTAGSAGGGLLKQIPKAWGAATNAAARASVPTSKVVDEVLSAAGASKGTAATVGNVAGKAVKYAPHLAAGLVAEDAYQHAKYSPVVQGPKNFVLGRVPYTQPWAMRQYQMQQGMMF